MSLMIDRFLLSRLESLSALLQVFQIFRGRAELAASRPMARQCLPCHPSYSRLFVPPYRRLPLQPQTRLTLASALWPQWFLVDVCARAGKTLISRSNLSASGSCRARTGLPPMAFAVSFRIRFADAKTAVKHHRPTHIRPLGPHHKCTLISRPTAVHHGYIYIESVRRYTCHFTALLPMCIRLT